MKRIVVSLLIFLALGASEGCAKKKVTWTRYIPMPCLQELKKENLVGAKCTESKDGKTWDCVNIKKPAESCYLIKEPQ